MDCITFLLQDHEKIEEIFSELARLGEHAIRSKRVLADQLIERISLHIAVEERVLYPAIRNEVQASRTLLDEYADDHHLISSILARLAETPPSASEFARDSHELRDRVRGHAQHEVRELFPLLQHSFNAGSLIALGKELERYKRYLQDEHSHEGPRAFLDEAIIS